MADQVPGAMPTQPTAEAGAMPAEAPKPEGELSLEDYKRQHGEMQAALKKANKEAEAYRKAEAARQKDAEDKAAAELSEAQKANKRAEKLQSELAEAQTKLRAAELRETIRAEVAKQKVVWFDAQAESDAVEKLTAALSGEDAPEAAQALKDLVKARPYLLAPAAPTAPAAPVLDGPAPHKTGQPMSEAEKQRIAASYGVRPEYVKV